MSEVTQYACTHVSRYIKLYTSVRHGKYPVIGI